MAKRIDYKAIKADIVEWLADGKEVRSEQIGYRYKITSYTGAFKRMLQEGIPLKRRLVSTTQKPTGYYLYSLDTEKL